MIVDRWPCCLKGRVGTPTIDGTGVMHPGNYTTLTRCQWVWSSRL